MRFRNIETRQQNYTSLRAAFRSENGAIDLASIMVGIIVIGLIGGVIAATVFAVIPWAQDNAAKQQLDSIHTAQNAAYGLSADPTMVTDEALRNKFTDSAGLATASLLSQSPTYCAIQTPDGKDYNAYSRSASGKIWTASNSSKRATVLTGAPLGTCSTLGTGTTAGTGTPTPTVGTQFMSIDAGESSGIALDNAGQAWTWGYGAQGQLGNGLNTISTVPVKVSGDHVFVQVSSGSHSNYALDADGQAWAWGNNNYGELGNGTTSVQSNIPAAVLGGHVFKSIIAGPSTAFALDAGGKAWAWGSGTNGALGNGTAGVHSNVPVAVSGGQVFTKMAANTYSAFGLDETGKAWAWGSNANGELGDGTTVNKSIPTAVSGNRLYTHIEAGVAHTVAIDSAGKGWAWGADTQGQLGNDAAFAKKLVPTAIFGDRTYKAITAGHLHTTAIDSAGKAWAWGADADGQLGSSDYSGSALVATPTAVTSAQSFVTVGSGYTNNFAIDTSGQAWAWGYGYEGRLGNGSSNSSALPAKLNYPTV